MSDTERKVVFRSAVGGFNKKDVNLYIFNENRRFASIEQSYINTIDELRSELEAKVNEIHCLGERISILEGISEKLAEAENEIEFLSKERSELQTTALDLTVKLEEKNKAIQELEASSEAACVAIRAEYEATIADIKLSFEGEISALKHEISAKDLSLENANIEKVGALTALESMKHELEAEKTKNSVLSEENAAISAKQAKDSKEAEILADELILRAKQASEEILTRAEEGAAIIIERAKDEALLFRNDILCTAKEMISAASDELQRSVGICLNDFVNGMRSSKLAPRRGADDIGRFDDNLARRITRMQNDLDRAIAEKLAEFDRKHGILR